jgi:DNA polymerase
VSRERAQQLARGFAAHLRHLREFRGLRYVGAAPLPARDASSDAPLEPPGRAGATTWSQRHDPAASFEPAAVRSDPGIASPTLAPNRAPDGASPTWPKRQVSEEPARPRAAAAAVPTPAARPATATHLPIAGAPAAEALRGDAAVRDQARTWTAAEKLEYLRRKNIGNCQRCKLAPTRTNLVFGVGDPNAALMFIGEAPGFDEDREGEPFVGAAGRRLTQWLGRLGLTREQVYIANVLKCRPPNNRNPEPDEVERCAPFVRAQIRAIAPQVLVALGRYAGMLLTGKPEETTLASMRGRSWTYRDPAGGPETPLFVTYHPSYVIRRERELPPGQRNPADDTVMADLQQALQRVRRS